MTDTDEAVDLSDLDLVRRHIDTSSWPNKPLCYALVDALAAADGGEVERLTAENERLRDAAGWLDLYAENERLRAVADAALKWKAAHDAVMAAPSFYPTAVTVALARADKELRAVVGRLAALHADKEGDR